jgi:hypothetical protein
VLEARQATAGEQLEHQVDLRCTPSQSQR